MFVKRVMLVIGVVVTALGGVALAQDKSNVVDLVVATINGTAIHLSDVKEARSRLPPKLQGAPLKAAYPVLLNSLINTRLAAAQAKRLGFDKEPEYIQRMRRISQQVLERMMLTRHIEKTLTDTLVQERYVQRVEQAKTQFETRARHILVKDKNVALAIIARLDNGDDFADLAQKYSIGPSAAQGGKLGWFGPGRMVKPFEEAAKALAVGAHSKAPVRSQFGWHVILVEERRPVAVPSFAESRATLVNELSAELGQNLMKSLRKDATIETTSFAELSKTLQK